jgi:hypothetical protein
MPISITLRSDPPYTLSHLPIGKHFAECTAPGFKIFAKGMTQRPRGWTYL